MRVVRNLRKSKENDCNRANSRIYLGNSSYSHMNVSDQQAGAEPDELGERNAGHFEVQKECEEEPRTTLHLPEAASETKTGTTSESAQVSSFSELKTSSDSSIVNIAKGERKIIEVCDSLYQ